jgi:hypothetical protein
VLPITATRVGSREASPWTNMATMAAPAAASAKVAGDTRGNVDADSSVHVAAAATAGHSTARRNRVNGSIVHQREQRARPAPASRKSRKNSASSRSDAAGSPKLTMSAATPAAITLAKVPMLRRTCVATARDAPGACPNKNSCRSWL